MNKLKLELNKELDVMVALEITAEEWLFIQLLYLCEEGDTDSLFRYFTQAKKDSIPKATLQSLQEKGIISPTYKIPGIGEAFDPAKIKLTDKFSKKYFKVSGEMGLELLQAYPLFITSGNKSFPMKNISKQFKSLEDFSFMYAKAIKFDRSKHEEVLSIIEWSKENELIQFGLAEFVISRKWEDLGKLKSGESLINFVRTFDNSELI